ncbi:MAG: LysE family translocator [Rhodospirillaceae bacterium]|nr:LysE family translocator [Rhodospirillaceae bacterium]MBT5940796.1 LysE family translocator [Rhodospirillaceae bacterium]
MRQGINAGSKTICRLDDWLGVFYLKLIMPVEISILSAFLIAAAAIVLSPGPDTIIIIRYTMSSGKRIGIATVAGVQLGLVFHTVLAIFGITVIIASSEMLFKGVAIAGALYLAWLGIQGFLPGSATFGFSGALPEISAHKAWRDAFFSNALNPKVIVLYLALMPNFIDLERGNTGAQLAVLGTALIIINIFWQTGLVIAADKARDWLGTPGVQKAVSWTTGAILIFFAAIMLWTNVF